MDDDQRDSDTGRYTERFSDADIVEIVAAEGPLGTVDVAEQLDCSQQAAYERLQALEESDEVASRMIGGNRVWMLPE